MAREREPARNPLMPSQAKVPVSAASEKEPVPIMSSPLPSANGASQDLSPQPEFGRPSALTNAVSPLAKVSAATSDVKKIRRSGDDRSMFAKKRPGDIGYHKPPSLGNPLLPLGRDASAQSQSQTSQSDNLRSNPYGLANSSHPLTERRPQASAFSRPTRQDGDVFTISQPAIFPQPSYRPAAPSQTFSSNVNTNPFIRPAATFVDPSRPWPLANADDGFSDAQVFGNDRFGTADPTMYLDSKKADENIKALLEGAMDDEDDRPRTRRKKKEMEKKVDDLSKQMQNMDVNTETAEVAEEDDEEDDGSRDGLKVKLLPHQIDGVAWMMNKERGTKKVKGILPHGGILADDMGLGKTIQSIALILGNPRPSDDEMRAAKKKQKVDLDEYVLPDHATLVVAPLALIKQWEAELRDRVQENHELKVRVHHGPQRTKSYKDLCKYDVVITTYQTLSSEHAENATSEKSALFGVKWYRIILDEAHSIKNRNAKTTKAACALDAEYRWCLTGTPMQNNLDELQSLIHFLRIKPYDNLEVWREQITKPMNKGRGGLSIRRLRAFLGAFMKRRTKDVLKLDGGLKTAADGNKKGSSNGFKIVKRTVEKVEVDFNEQERLFYDRLQARTNKSLELMMAGNLASYASVLVLLMRLRQACNHHQLLGADLSKEQDAMAGSRTPSRNGSKTDDIDDIANMLGGLSVETTRCDVCQIDLSEQDVQPGLIRCQECEEDLKVAQSSAHKPKRKKEKKIVKQQRKVNRRVVTDSDDEDDQEAPIVHESSPEHGEEEHEESATSSSDDDASYPISSHNLKASPTSSTKIRHLLKILKHDSHTHKYIVFSFFTSMLDLIEPFLKRHNLVFARYDGSMRNDAREASLEQLRTNPRVRILLCSLRAGSLGLNLTAASRVVVLEPFWNPFVEEQAIDRVHRLNQTQDVIVHKLTVRDTVESRILELQERKRELANATIEGQKGSGAAKVTMQELLQLFKPDAESDAKLDMIGMKGGRSLLDRDSQRTSTATTGTATHGNGAGTGAGAEQRRAESRAAAATRRPEDPVYGRRW